MLIRNFAEGSLLVLALLVSPFGHGLGAPWSLGGAKWGFAQEGNILCKALRGCVLLAISSSVWTSGIFLRTLNLWCVTLHLGVGL